MHPDSEPVKSQELEHQLPPTASHSSQLIAPPVWFLAISSAVAVIGLTILTPALPLVKTELGVSSSAVQQLLTVYMIALAVGQLIFGSLSDRFGRRPILLLGAVMYTAGCILATFSTDITLLIVLRALQGLGAAACTSMSRAMVNDVYERSEAARQLSAIAIALAVAPALSLIFGGFIAETAGWQGTMALLTIAGILVTAMAYAKGNETHLQPETSINVGSIASAYKSVLRNREFLAWTLSCGMQVGIFFSFNGFLAYQYQRHGYSLAEFGIWFSLVPLSYILGNSCNRKWFVARGIERAAMVGCCLSLAATILLFSTQAIGMTSALSLALPCALFGFGNGIVVANSMAGAIAASGQHAGTGSGVVGAWQMAAGGIAGTLIIALGGDEHFSIAAGITILMAIVSVVSMAQVYRNRVVD